MARHVVNLVGGDLVAIVIDTNTNRIEIYDEVPEETDETPLEHQTGPTVLIQGHLTPKTKIALVRALNITGR